jgi:hypothetical protein
MGGDEPGEGGWYMCCDRAKGAGSGSLMELGRETARIWFQAKVVHYTSKYSV